jgi:pimeloyl-ACP methyl ester carboxylesterase
MTLPSLTTTNRVYRYDIPGYGRSPAPNSLFDDLAEVSADPSLGAEFDQAAACETIPG